MHGIIFDCDGVLVDSEPVSCKASSTVLQKYGVNISPEEMAADFTGKSEKQMVLEIGQKHQISFPMGILDEIQDLYFELAAELQPMPGLVGILDLLRTYIVGIAHPVASHLISLKGLELDRIACVAVLRKGLMEPPQIFSVDGRPHWHCSGKLPGG